MLNSINIGTSGLTGFSKELQTISNNVANLNTPSFKGSNAQFSDLFAAGDNAGGDGNGGARGASHSGYGLATLPSVIDFSQGQINQTGNDLDVAIDGEGFLVTHDDLGQTLYSRDGRLKFNQDELLVNQNGAKVQGLNAQGALHDISLAGLHTNTASASTKITLAGVLLNADANKQITGIKVIDSAGGSHDLTIDLSTGTPATAGTWQIAIKDGATTVGNGQVHFIDGRLDPAQADISFDYAPANAKPMSLALSFDPGVTSSATGNSTLAVSKIDGYGEGELVKTTFDTLGKLVLSYSNGQIVRQQTLALAHPGNNGDLEAVSGNSFRSRHPESITLGVAEVGKRSFNAESLEGSNVDLSKEFSAIIVTQRGYQAASELISTANQMLDTLMHMKG